LSTRRDRGFALMSRHAIPVTDSALADAFVSFEQVMCSSVHGMAHQTHGNRNRHREDSAGFTLFELVIVMLIVAVMAAIAIPSFRYVTTSNRIASEVNQLLGDMRFARTEAIKEGQTVTVCSSTNPTASTPTCSTVNSWQTGWIVFSDPNNLKAIPAGGAPLRVQPSLNTAYNSSDTITATNNVSAVTFNREGFGATNGSSTTATTWLQVHSTPASIQWTRCLQVTPIGMVTVVTTSTAVPAGGCS
jgi:type IV fimbrial biogenesis protein FimT